MKSVPQLIFRPLAVGFLYLMAKCGLPLAVRLAHYKKAVIGTCTIWAPSNELHLIVSGVEYLRDLDSEMFRKLTVGRKYILWYQKKRRTNAFEAYSISDHYLRYGKEGVVICLIQTVLNRTMQDSLGRVYVKHSEALVADRENRKQISDFVRKHSFSAKLMEQYQIAAEK